MDTPPTTTGNRCTLCLSLFPLIHMDETQVKKDLLRRFIGLLRDNGEPKSINPNLNDTLYVQKFSLKKTYIKPDFKKTQNKETTPIYSRQSLWMGSALTKTPSSSSADEFAMESHECRRLPMTSPSYPETTQHRFRFVREEKYHQDT